MCLEENLKNNSYIIRVWVFDMNMSPILEYLGVC